METSEGASVGNHFSSSCAHVYLKDAGHTINTGASSAYSKHNRIACADLRSPSRPHEHASFDLLAELYSFFLEREERRVHGCRGFFCVEGRARGEGCCHPWPRVGRLSLNQECALPAVLWLCGVAAVAVALGRLPDL